MESQTVPVIQPAFSRCFVQRPGRVHCAHSTAVVRRYTGRIDAVSEEQVSSAFDVSGAVVNPTYRSTPWQADEETISRSKVKILLISESNVCRSVIAQGILTNLIEECGLSDCVECASKGTRDYNVGEGPEESVTKAVEDLSFFLPKTFEARQFDHARDIVEYDLLLVVDKYTASDVLREIAVYDTIQKDVAYSRKVRKLGEFHPRMKLSQDPEGLDFEDPLYGNWGGQEEVEAVKKVTKEIEVACLGLIQVLQELQERTAEDPSKFRKSLCDQIQAMEGISWLVPPMLDR